MLVAGEPGGRAADIVVSQYPRGCGTDFGVGRDGVIDHGPQVVGQPRGQQKLEVERRVQFVRTQVGRHPI